MMKHMNTDINDIQRINEVDERIANAKSLCQRPEQDDKKGPCNLLAVIGEVNTQVHEVVLATT